MAGSFYNSTFYSGAFYIASSSVSITGVIGHGTFTGHTSSILQPKSVTGIVGHGSYAGHTSSITQPKTVQGVSGHGSFTGYSSLVQQPHAVTGVAGHGTITGYTSTVTRTSNQAITSTICHGAYSGYAATILQPHLVASVKGSLSGTGYVPTVATAPYILTIQDVWNYKVDGTHSMADLMRVMSAVLAGNATGLQSGSATFSDLSNSSVRLSSTMDASGNRSITSFNGGNAISNVSRVYTPYDVWSANLGDGYTAVEMFEMMSSILAGNATGLSGASQGFSSVDGSKTVVTGSYSSGTRTVSLTP